MGELCRLGIPGMPHNASNGKQTPQASAEFNAGRPSDHRFFMTSLFFFGGVVVVGCLCTIGLVWVSACVQGIKEDPPPIITAASSCIGDQPTKLSKVINQPANQINQPTEQATPNQNQAD